MLTKVFLGRIASMSEFFINEAYSDWHHFGIDAFDPYPLRKELLTTQFMRTIYTESSPNSTHEWSLFLDDLRDQSYVPHRSNFVTARSTNEAVSLLVKYRMPEFISFDHDLGPGDRAMDFLKRMYELFPDGPVPEYQVHSSNPVGRENIISFMDSWKRSLE